MKYQIITLKNVLLKNKTQGDINLITWSRIPASKLAMQSSIRIFYDISVVVPGNLAVSCGVRVTGWRVDGGGMNIYIYRLRCAKPEAGFVHDISQVSPPVFITEKLWHMNKRAFKFTSFKINSSRLIMACHMVLLYSLF